MSRTSFKPGNMLYPLPAVMVSCQEPGGKPNIITVAWTGTVCSDPAMVYISVRPERFSHGIISRTGEFVINLIDAGLTRSMDYCGVKSGRDVDKFAECGLHEVPSNSVGAPSIEESPVCIECKVTQCIPLGSHDMFLAQVTAVTVDEKLLDEKGRFHLNRAGLTAYSHGEYYSLGECIGSFGYSVRKKPAPAKAACSVKTAVSAKKPVPEKATCSVKTAVSAKKPASAKAAASATKPSIKKRSTAAAKKADSATRRTGKAAAGRKNI